MKNYIEEYKNVLPSETCDLIINKFNEKTELVKPGIVTGGILKPEVKNTLDLALMNSGVSTKKEIDLLLSSIMPVLEEGIRSYFIKYNILPTTGKLSTQKGASLLKLNDFLEQLVWPRYIVQNQNLHAKKYLPGKNYYHWHCDQEPGVWGVFCRRLVMMFYLNDVESGGETEFLNQEIGIKPSKGTLVIFPADFVGRHRGVTPKSGEKYILNFWLCERCPPLMREVAQNMDRFYPKPKATLAAY